LRYSFIRKAIIIFIQINLIHKTSFFCPLYHPTNPHQYATPQTANHTSFLLTSSKVTKFIVCSQFFVTLQYSWLFHRSAGWRRGKSGQHRAPYFLTGRYPWGYSSVTENNHPPAGGKGWKGEVRAYRSWWRHQEPYTLWVERPCIPALRIARPMPGGGSYDPASDDRTR